MRGEDVSQHPPNHLPAPLRIRGGEHVVVISLEPVHTARRVSRPTRGSLLEARRTSAGSVVDIEEVDRRLQRRRLVARHVLVREGEESERSTQLGGGFPCVARK